MNQFFFTHPLPAVVKLIGTGEIMVPTFQRAFVWRRSHVREFFKSINRGFPIGVLIAVEGPPDRYERMSSSLSGLPQPRDDRFFSLSNTLWILDGLQRLTALFKGLTADTEFTLFYELSSGKFLFENELVGATPYIGMSSLFDYQSYLDVQVNLSRLPEGGRLVKLANELHGRFQGYAVPIQVLQGAADAEIFEIFASLNASGVTLTEKEIAISRDLHGDHSSRQRINLSETHEVRYWTKVLGCTEAQLRAAVATAGSNAESVRKLIRSDGRE